MSNHAFTADRKKPRPLKSGGYNNKTVFEQSEETLISMLKHGVSGPEVNLHSWLTLPSMEIIDFSLPTSYAIKYKEPEGVGSIITRHPSDFIHGVKYKPMLIGSKFLIKSGVIKFANV